MDFYRAQLERDPDERDVFRTTLCITIGDIVTIHRKRESYFVTLIWSWKMNSEFVVPPNHLSWLMDSMAFHLMTVVVSVLVRVVNDITVSTSALEKCLGLIMTRKRIH